MSTLTPAMMAPARRSGIRAKLKAKPATRLSTRSANSVIATRGVLVCAADGDRPAIGLWSWRACQNA
jgi:hypothetical protein